MPMRIYLNVLEGHFWVEVTSIFPYRTQFIVELRCEKTSFQDELFLHNRHFKSCLVSIVSSTLPSCNGETKTHIKSDYIVSLMEQFASQFCQHHTLAATPKSTMSAGCRTIRHHLFYPWCPLTLSSWLQTHTHTLNLSFSHTHFRMMDISLLNDEWEAQRPI